MTDDKIAEAVRESLHYDPSGLSLPGDLREAGAVIVQPNEQVVPEGIAQKLVELQANQIKGRCRICRNANRRDGDEHATRHCARWSIIVPTDHYCGDFDAKS